MDEGIVVVNTTWVVAWMRYPFRHRQSLLSVLLSEILQNYNLILILPDFNIMLIIFKFWQNFCAQCNSVSWLVVLCSPTTTSKLATACLQWAAVRTEVEDIKEPPQNGLKLPLDTKATCHGYWFLEAGWPPTIRVEWPLTVPHLHEHHLVSNSFGFLLVR